MAATFTALTLGADFLLWTVAKNKMKGFGPGIEVKLGPGSSSFLSGINPFLNSNTSGRSLFFSFRFRLDCNSPYPSPGGKRLSIC